MSDKKVEVMYFYSDMQEDEKALSKISRKLSRKRNEMQIRLINIEDPRNGELTDLYGVNIVPLLVFLTSRGEIAARRFLPLSAEDVVQEIADQVCRGELPNPWVEEVRTRMLEALKSVTRRNDLTELVVEQIESDLMEASAESEIFEMVNSHISAINHAISDLQEFKKVLKKYEKHRNDFVV